MALWHCGVRGAAPPVLRVSAVRERVRRTSCGALRAVRVANSVQHFSRVPRGAMPFSGRSPCAGAPAFFYNSNGAWRGRAQARLYCQSE